MSGNQKNLISASELSVLQFLKNRLEFLIEANDDDTNEDAVIEIGEISANTGIRDNDEILRALYTLEGKQLVRPFPQGDFTSNRWQITDHGVRAIDLIANG